MYKKLLVEQNGEVFDKCEFNDGLSPAQLIADTGIFDTGITGARGIMTFHTENDSVNVPLYIESGVFVVGTATGSALFSTAKDTASKINIYVEAGTLQVQNLTGADVQVYSRF